MYILRGWVIGYLYIAIFIGGKIVYLLNPLLTLRFSLTLYLRSIHVGILPNSTDFTDFTEFSWLYRFYRILPTLLIISSSADSTDSTEFCRFCRLLSTLLLLPNSAASINSTEFYYIPRYFTYFYNIHIIIYKLLVYVAANYGPH